MESTNNVPKPKRSKEGSLNPMWGKSQSLETKQKISNSQKDRYERIRKALQTEDTAATKNIGETNVAAQIDLLKQCLFTDNITFKDAEQAHNFIAIMSDGINSNYLKSVINDELNRYLNNINRHV
nr:NUMOD3 domain-containing DNA-binding protein [Bacteroides intestinalis]